MTENQWNSNAVLNAPYSSHDFKKGKKREKGKKKGKEEKVFISLSPLRLSPLLATHSPPSIVEQNAIYARQRHRDTIRR